MWKMCKQYLSFRPSFEISIGVVLFVVCEGKPLFLLLRYPHGHWDFVKGHKEKGETETQTLRRELLEEAGIDQIEILPGFREDVHFRYTAKGTEKVKRQEKGQGLFIYKQVIYYVARTKQTEVKLSEEHYDWAWLSYKEAHKRITHKNSRQVLCIAKDHIDRTL